MQNHLIGVELGYHLPDGFSLFTSLTFSFSAVRTGLVGPNGVGKTTLLEILAGRLAPAQGSLTRCGRISYLPQMVAFAPEATVAEAIHLADKLSAHERIAQGEGTMRDLELVENCWDLPDRVEMVLTRLRGDLIEGRQPVANLSGGELTRVRIAGLLLEEPDFLILDEPTNQDRKRTRLNSSQLPL